MISRRFLAAGMADRWLIFPGQAQASRTAFLADVLFTPNSSAIRKSDQATYERMICQLDGRDIQIVIAVGHTGRDEKGVP